MAPPDISITAFQEYLLGVKSPVTAKRYSEYASKFLKIVQEAGYKSFTQIPPGMLSEFSAMLSRQKNSASTVRVHVFAAKKYLEWVAMRGVKVTPQHRPELPRQDIRHRPVLPPDLFSLYFQHADLDLQEPTRTAVMLLPCCGLRAQELVSLRLDNIHRGVVKLQNGKEKQTLYLRVVGKGNKERNVPLMEEGVEILTGYLAGWRRRQKGPWLFPSLASDELNGLKHIGERMLRKALQKMREPLGMDFTPHTMRRTYITMLWRRKVDLKTIAAIAGHSNIQTTINHYIVMEPQDALQALQDAGSSLT